MRNKDKRIQTDCLSVLEQVGLLEPELIEDYVADFISYARIPASLLVG